MDREIVGDSDPLGATGVARFSAGYVSPRPGVQLRLLEWHPIRGCGRPVVFVPGWVSALEGWLDLLRVLIVEHPVFYLETREKGSAELAETRVEDFRMAAMAEEVMRALGATGQDPEQCIVMGSSLGASILLEAMKHDRLRPYAAFLVGPTCHFRFPWWGYLITLLPTWFYAVVKHPVLWYLRIFRVDAKREPEQMRRYERTLKVAHAGRLKMSARAVAGLSVWRDLETIHTPVAVAYAASDMLHGAHEARRLVEALPQGVAVPCPSNKHMHSAELKPDFDRFLRSLRAESD